MGYGMKLTDSLLREKVRKIGPFRRENKTILCRRYGSSLNDEASDVLVPALSSYGVSRMGHTQKCGPLQQTTTSAASF